MNKGNLNLEELKKSFIVDKGKFERERLPEFIKRTLKYARLDSEGGVHIHEYSLTIRDKIALSLISRFIANKLEPSIKSEMSGEELSTILDVDKAVIFARLKDLSDSKMVSRLDKGTYEIVPYYIETLLNDIDAKYSSKEDSSSEDNTTSNSKIRKTEFKKSIKKIPEATVDDDFLNKVMNINKANYTYISNLSSFPLKILGVLYMVEKELKMEWLSSPEILKILSEKFRIKAIWSTISTSLKELDQKGFVESRSKEGHSTARIYRIMQQGQDYLEKEIEKLQIKTT